MKQKILILGAGPAGLALAMKLLRRPDLNTEVVVIEQKPYVGGLTASFEYEGLYFDHGSHRLHPVIAPDILQDIRTLLGSDLLDRPRNGRIWLSGRSVKFPLNFLDLALHLPPSFIVGIGWDIITKHLRRERKPYASFADVLLDRLGWTICDTFYFPYARKLWGLDPEEIATVQAERRVSANNIARIVRKALAVIPGFKPEGAGHFLYPRRGFGQISQVLKREIEHLGGEIQLSTTVQEIRLRNGRLASIVVRPSKTEQARDQSPIRSSCEEIFPDFLFSTIPVPNLVNCLRPEPPLEVRNACQHIQYRTMVLCYLVLGTDHFTPYDAHYFPESDTIFSRLSEPKNYSDSQEPHRTTGLCVEIPCSFGDDIWRASEDEISSLVIKDLMNVGLPVGSPIKAAFIRHLSYAYPTYDLNFEPRFRIVDDYLSQISGLVSLGRQGLFAHDNTHHTMEMAYRASECLQPRSIWDSDMWRFYRKQFSKHVVED